MSREVWCHWQNLNERDGSTGSGFRHGRAWLHWGDACWQVSWNFWGYRWLGLTFSSGGCDHDYSVSVGLVAAHLYFGVRGLRSYHAMQRSWPRETGVRLSGDHLVLEWNCDDSSWSSKTGPAHGWQKSWFVLDVLFGRAKYTSVEARPIQTSVVMPEGSYPCTVTMHLDSWKRPRWPHTLRIQRATVDIPNSIPVPGKGENSWDCGDDGIYGLTCPADSVADAVSKVVANALRTREKYASKRWAPDAGWPAHMKVGDSGVGA